VLEIWQLAVQEASNSPEKLLSSVAVSAELVAEYERLFVGPGTIPCPPYEAVWRSDRPKHEQGTVMGQSTARTKEIYRELGMRLRPGEVELPDHIAVELEALAQAWTTDDTVQADALVGLLQGWLPPFAASVAANSQLEFYRNLAELTWEFFLHLGPGDGSCHCRNSLGLDSVGSENSLKGVNA
jgi:TorA maturation chaperone TorD